ncbi:MAG: long-chain fatty acid--CoA ligase, partial [Deltaproteobacteria bacterium]
MGGANRPWESSRWPEGVAHEISGYEKPLFSILDNVAKDYPASTYTIFSGFSKTFAQVKDTSDRIARFLVERGLNKGDRVAVFLPNIPQYPEILFGIVKAGGVCVTCNPLYKAHELNYQLKDAGASMAFVMDHPEFYTTAVEAFEGTDVNTVVICNIKSYLPGLKALLGSLLGKIPKAKSHEPGHLMYDDVVKNSRPEPPHIDIDPVNDPAVIVYTGGTTGVPKGAVLSHANLVSNVMVLEEWIRLEEYPGGPLKKAEKGGAHCYLGVLPWYHSFGLTVCMLASCNSGSRLVCVPNPRAGNPPFTDVLKSIEKYKITTFVGVPTIYSAIVNHPLTDKFDLSSIVGCGSGAAPLPVEVIKQFEERTGAVIYEGYGMSETSPILTLNPTNRQQRKIGTVGLPVPNTDIKIVDLDTGQQELPMGQDGEIAASGPQVMLGYWNKPEANEESFRTINGKRYLLTGDIGHFDEHHLLVQTDRQHDTLIVAGFNAYPNELALNLYSHTK